MKVYIYIKFSCLIGAPPTVSGGELQQRSMVTLKYISLLQNITYVPYSKLWDTVILYNTVTIITF